MIAIVSEHGLAVVPDMEYAALFIGDHNFSLGAWQAFDIKDNNSWSDNVSAQLRAIALQYTRTKIVDGCRPLVKTNRKAMTWRRVRLLRTKLDSHLRRCDYEQEHGRKVGRASVKRKGYGVWKENLLKTISESSEQK